MLERLRESLLRPVIQRWLSTSDRSWRSLKSPSGTAHISTAGPDPDRILVVGGGITAGWGMRGHEEAFPGHLAALVSVSTGRGISMNVVVDDILSDRRALSTSVTSMLRLVDAIVITPGDIDSLLMLPTAAYRGRVNAAIDRVTELAPASARIFIVGLAPLSSIISMPRILRWFTARLSRDLDREARHAARSRMNATFVPLASVGAPGSASSGAKYCAWAGMIAPVVSAQLDASNDHIIR